MLCPFDQVSFNSALLNAQGAVLLVASPRFNQTAFGQPAVDIVVDEVAARGADAPPTFQALVYDVIDGDERRLSEIANALALTSEPVLLAISADGVVTARLSNLFDQTEVAELFDTL